MSITGRNLKLRDFELVTGNCNDEYEGNLFTLLVSKCLYKLRGILKTLARPTKEFFVKLFNSF